MGITIAMLSAVMIHLVFFAVTGDFESLSLLLGTISVAISDAFEGLSNLLSQLPISF